MQMRTGTGFDLGCDNIEVEFISPYKLIQCISTVKFDSRPKRGVLDTTYLMSGFLLVFPISPVNKSDQQITWNIVESEVKNT